jgi:hypothetical protein
MPLTKTIFPDSAIFIEKNRVLWRKSEFCDEKKLKHYNIVGTQFRANCGPAKLRSVPPALAKADAPDWTQVSYWARTNHSPLERDPSVNRLGWAGLPPVANARGGVRLGWGTALRRDGAVRPERRAGLGDQAEDGGRAGGPAPKL